MKLPNRIHLTEKMNGKMRGFASISNNANKFCAKMAADKKNICSKCYANRMKSMYKDLNNCMNNNAEILSKQIVGWTILNYAYFRLQAFGDVVNQKNIDNYFNLCERNPHTRFALWTKRPRLFHKVLRRRKKPNNLILIRSSDKINKANKLPQNFDKVFTVYDKQFIEENKIKINCGAKSCLKCRKCYTKNKVTFINEVLK